MKRILNYFRLMAMGLAVVCVSCQSEEKIDEEVDENIVAPTLLEITALQKAAISQQQDFCIDLFKAMDSANDGNLIMSPLSVSMALSIAANGVDADAQGEMVAKLGFTSLQDLNDLNHYLINALPKADPTYAKVNLANAVWFNSNRVSKIDSNFSDVLVNKYLGAARLSDFSKSKSLAKEMNEWCAQNTFNYITEAVSDDNIKDVQTMWILNALYFKGHWRMPFDKDNTESSQFYDASGKKVCKIDMMYMANNRKAYKETNAAESIVLEYGENNRAINHLFYMDVVLPKDGVSLGDAVKSVLTEGQYISHPVNLHMPKFEYKMDKSISQYLSDIGFNLYGIYMPIIGTTNDLELRQVAKIEVDEEGTKAAAITESNFGTADISGMSDTLIDFNVNRPFAFIIREASSDAILFIGKITNPSQKQ